MAGIVARTVIRRLLESWTRWHGRNGLELDLLLDNDLPLCRESREAGKEKAAEEIRDVEAADMPNGSGADRSQHGAAESVD